MKNDFESTIFLTNRVSFNGSTRPFFVSTAKVIDKSVSESAFYYTAIFGSKMNMENKTWIPDTTSVKYKIILPNAEVATENHNDLVDLFRQGIYPWKVIKQ